MRRSLRVAQAEERGFEEYVSSRLEECLRALDSWPSRQSKCLDLVFPMGVSQLFVQMQRLNILHLHPNRSYCFCDSADTRDTDTVFKCDFVRRGYFCAFEYGVMMIYDCRFSISQSVQKWRRGGRGGEIWTDEIAMIKNGGVSVK